MEETWKEFLSLKSGKTEFVLLVFTHQNKQLYKKQGITQQFMVKMARLKYSDTCHALANVNPSTCNLTRSRHQQEK